MARQECSKEMLRKRVEFLETQCRSLQKNIKYHNYRLMEKKEPSFHSVSQVDEEVVRLLLRLVPHNIRSVEKIKDLANSNHSWKEILLRHPLKIKLWRTAKSLQRGRKI